MIFFLGGSPGGGGGGHWFVAGYHRLLRYPTFDYVGLGQPFRHSFVMCFWVHKLMRPTRGFRSLRASDFGLWPLDSGVQQGCQSFRKKKTGHFISIGPSLLDSLAHYGLGNF